MLLLKLSNVYVRQYLVIIRYMLSDRAVRLEQTKLSPCVFIMNDLSKWWAKMSEPGTA